jgi:hypothetical protein
MPTRNRAEARKAGCGPEVARAATVDTPANRREPRRSCTHGMGEKEWLPSCRSPRGGAQVFPDSPPAGPGTLSLPLICPPVGVRWAARQGGLLRNPRIPRNSFCMGDFKNRLLGRLTAAGPASGLCAALLRCTHRPGLVPFALPFSPLICPPAMRQRAARQDGLLRNPRFPRNSFCMGDFKNRFLGRLTGHRPPRGRGFRPSPCGLTYPAPTQPPTLLTLYLHRQRPPRTAPPTHPAPPAHPTSPAPRPAPLTYPAPRPARHPAHPGVL